jgi:hypothetical protein
MTYEMDGVRIPVGIMRFLSLSHSAFSPVGIMGYPAVVKRQT